MEKQIIQQKDGDMIYTDGSRETIADYRQRLDIKPKDHSKKYTPDQLADRLAAIEEIFRYDKSAGMHYDIEKGFIRNQDGSYYVSIEHAIETFAGVTTRELKNIHNVIIKNTET